MDYQEVGAGAGLFDQADAVVGVLVAVELSYLIILVAWICCV